MTLACPDMITLNVPDLSGVPLDVITLDTVVQRVLPDEPAAPELGTAFASSI